MDGHFVPNLSYGPDMVREIHAAFPELKLDVHLMMDHPEEYIQRFAQEIHVVEIERRFDGAESFDLLFGDHTSLYFRYSPQRYIKNIKTHFFFKDIVGRTISVSCAVANVWTVRVPG